MLDFVCDSGLGTRTVCSNTSSIDCSIAMMGFELKYPVSCIELMGSNPRSVNQFVDPSALYHSETSRSDCDRTS